MFQSSAYPPPTGRWFGYALSLFLAAVLAWLVILSAANGHLVNAFFFPVARFLPMFELMWQDAPLGALAFLATKSLIAFGHRDAASGLDVWTLEFDAISLLIFAAAALLGGRLLASAPRAASTWRWGLAGMVLMMVSASYGTSIAHCAGPTWLVYVALLGAGWEFAARPLFWPWLVGLLGLASLTIALRRVKAEKAAV